MESSERTLVIILGAALALFLVLGIFALIKIIQILNHLKRISEKAERFADKAEAVSEFFERASTPLAAGRLMANISDAIFKRRQRTSNKRRGRDA